MTERIDAIKRRIDAMRERIDAMGRASLRGNLDAESLALGLEDSAHPTGQA